MIPIPANMRTVTYVDPQGRKHHRAIPKDDKDSTARSGIPLGPPSLKSLKLPLEIEVRLHNELFDRRLFAEEDVVQRRQDVYGALTAAFRLDIETIIQVYRQTPVEESVDAGTAE